MQDSFEQARIKTLETTVHEATHHWIREVVGFPGLLAAGGPGRVGEGVAQVVAAAALVLEGKTDEERSFGQRLLDPSWQTTPVGELRFRDVRLSRTFEDLQTDALHPLEDMGGVHVHCGILINAHRLMAEQMGMEAMARLTFESIEELTPFCGIERWARITLRTAERLHGTDSQEARAVVSAWKAVGLDQTCLRATGPVWSQWLKRRLHDAWAALRFRP